MLSIMAAADNSPKSGVKQATLPSTFGIGVDPAVGAATQFKPGVSGNPAGKPKGSKHISTYIQEFMEDENFTARILDPNIGLQDYSGPAVKAIIQVAVVKAVNGDAKAMDWVARYGWSQKIENEHSGETKLIIEKRNYSGNGS